MNPSAKNSRAALALVSLAAAGAVAVAGLSVPARSDAPKAAAPKTDAASTAASKALYGEKCSACHNLPDPVEKSYTRAQWQRTVNQMLTKYKASDSISPPQAAQIVDYLAAFAPKAAVLNGGGRGGKNRNTDPWATDVADVWTEAPSATQVFNFEAVSPLSSFSALGAGTPGPAPLWSVGSDKAAKASANNSSANGTVARVSAPEARPDRFALLLDKSGSGHDLDTRVRFRIDAGKASPAVGLVIGCTDPKHYTVLRCNQTLGDLALIQISEPTHTTLQQTPLALPPAPAAPLAPGWHTLRVLVHNGEVRGWLDMQKRISVTLPGYTGGKVGLWSQGSTVASFDDWTVDWYDAPAAAPPLS